MVASGALEVSKNKNPRKYVKDLSLLKAESVYKKLDYKAIIVACDTIVYMKGKIFEKPKSVDEAVKNMENFSGKTNKTFTAVTIIDGYKNKTITWVDTCKVKFRNISYEDIKWYVTNEEDLLDKSGYAMYGCASLFVDYIKGDHNCAFGLSPSSMYYKLKKLGYKLTDFD